MVIGITVVKVGASYLGPVLFDDPDLIIRWLALSNGLGYLVGAIVGTICCAATSAMNACPPSHGPPSSPSPPPLPRSR